MSLRSDAKYSIGTSSPTLYFDRTQENVTPEKVFPVAFCKLSLWLSQRYPNNQICKAMFYSKGIISCK